MKVGLEIDQLPSALARKMRDKDGSLIEQVKYLTAPRNPPNVPIHIYPPMS